MSKYSIRILGSGMCADIVYATYSRATIEEYVSKYISPQHIFRVGSGKQVSNVIVDNGNSDDDDDTFVVQESQPLVDDEAQVSSEQNWTSFWQ